MRYHEICLHTEPLAVFEGKPAGPEKPLTPQKARAEARRQQGIQRKMQKARTVCAHRVRELQAQVFAK
jgi:hypothetical protein